MAEQLSLDDLNSMGGEFLSTKIGTNIENFDVSAYLKDEDADIDFQLKRKDKTTGAHVGVGYRYLLISNDAKKISVNNWKLHGELVALFKARDSIEGPIAIEHPGKGEYIVKDLKK